MAARETYDRIAAEITDGHEVIASQMFGMPVLKVRGKAFAGLHRGEVMTFKLPAPELESAKLLPGGGPTRGLQQISLTSATRCVAVATDHPVICAIRKRTSRIL